MRYLSICSGIEAASVAWAPFGWQAVGYSEIEPFPRAVLEQRLGAVPVDWDHRHRDGSNTVPLFGDFTRIEAHHVGPVDLLVGGTPCQSFSVAGKRLGLDDPRGHLTLEFLALAQRVRPRWIVWENVPGVLSDDGGRTFGTFLGLLGELGYGWAFRVIDAQFARVGGFERAVPQRRRRVFLVGYLGDWRRAAAVLFDRESLRGNPAPRRQAGEGVAAATAPCLTSSGRGVERTGETRGQDPVVAVAQVAPTLNAAFGDRQGLEDQRVNGGCGLFVAEQSGRDVFGTLTARMFNALGPRDVEEGALLPVFLDPLNQQASFEVAKTLAARGDMDGAGVVAHALRGEGFDASEDGTGRGTPLVPVMAQINMMGSKGSALVEENPETSFTLTRGCESGHDVHAVAIRTAQTSAANYSNPKPGDACHPLASGAHAPAVAFSFKDSGNDATEGASPTLRSLGAYDANGGSQMAVAYDLRGREGGAQFEGPHDTANIRAASGGSSKSYVAQTWAVRRLTPTECERLQGFPDGWTDIVWRKKAAPDGSRYKALGNSMAVNVMRFIGERIAQVDKALSPDQKQQRQDAEDHRQSAQVNGGLRHEI